MEHPARSGGSPGIRFGLRAAKGVTFFRADIQAPAGFLSAGRGPPGQHQSITLNYWRDKQKHEVDFVLCHRKSKELTAIECKYFRTHFDPLGIAALRRYYLRGQNYVVTTDATRKTPRSYDAFEVQFVSLPERIQELRHDA